MRLVVGLATGALVYAGLLLLTFVIGGSECDRGGCNAFGELAADDVGRWVLGIAYIGLAAAAGLAAARALR